MTQSYDLKPSIFAMILLAIIFCVSAYILITLPWSPFIKLVGMAMLIAYFASLIWRFGLCLSQYGLTKINYLGDQHYVLEKYQQNIQARLRGDSTITPYVSILRFQIKGRRLPYNSVIFRDSLKQGDYQRLLAMIRMG